MVAFLQAGKDSYKKDLTEWWTVSTIQGVEWCSKLFRHLCSDVFFYECFTQTQ